MCSVIATSPLWICALSLLLAPLQTFAGDAEKANTAQQPVDLQIGDSAPEFEALADSGKAWKSTEHVGDKTLIVYFYPADFTSGCSKQAEQFRDNMHKLVEQGVEVVGVSGDAVESHQLFKENQQLDFTLLSDQDASVAKQFGVPVRQGGRVVPRGADRKPLTDEDGKPVVLLRDVTLARWTFVIDPDGRFIYKNTRVNPAHDSQQILEFLSKDEK